MPETKPVFPLMVALAEASVVIAETLTWLVRAATVKVEPSVTTWPFAVIEKRVLMPESGVT